MDHTKHTPLSATEMNEANLIDAAIYGPDDEKIGTVAHLHVMAGATNVIVDAGGFLGIGSKPVALDVSQLDFMRDQDGTVHATTPLSKEHVKNLPEHHD